MARMITQEQHSVCNYVGDRGVCVGGGGGGGGWLFVFQFLICVERMCEK